MEDGREARFGLTPGRFSFWVRPRGLPGLALGPCGFAFPFGETLPSTGLKAKTRIAAAGKAKAGAAGKPKLHGKAKPQGAKAKPGNPRGRTQKLNRPGVKPKRASRPSSTRGRPR